MVKVILHGCNGRMGQVVTQLAAQDGEIAIVAGVDVNTMAQNGYPVYASLADCREDADVVVDFASATAVDALRLRCQKAALRAVHHGIV